MLAAKRKKKWPKNGIKKRFPHPHSLFFFSKKKKLHCIALRVFDPRKLRHAFFLPLY